VGSDEVSFASGVWNGFASISLDDHPNDGFSCPGPGCDGDNIHSDVEIIYGSPMDELISAGAGSQALHGLDGSDVLSGGAGNDVLDAGVGNDSLSGGGGDDALTGGSGGDTFIGNAGVDTVTYATVAARIKVTMNGIPDDGTAGEADNVTSDVERVIGSPFADTLIGDANANTLYGQAGDDTLKGAAGDDLLYGQTGNDTFNGGAGTDLCSQGGGTGPKTSCEN
jgi:Ca2+-binding RTX toxin-like protein